MKKIALFMLAAALLLTAFACAPAQGPAPVGSDPAPAEKTGVRQFEGVTINLIAEEQDPSYALQKQLPKFEELTGIKVNFEMGPIDSVVQKEMLALQGKTGDYDIISMPYQFLGNLVTNDYILPLDPLMNDESLKVIEAYDPDDMIVGMMDASGRWKDQLYGMASNTCIMFYGYRKDLFENADEQAAFKAKYGYDLAPPTDWKQYHDISEFFTRSKGENLAGEELKTDFYGTTICGKRHDAMTCEWLNYA